MLLRLAGVEKKKQQRQVIEKDMRFWEAPRKAMGGGGMDRDFDGSYLEDNLIKLENKQKTRPTHIPHPTSIPKSIHTHPAYKHTYKHTYKTKQKQYSQKQSRHIHNNALPKQHPKQHPKNRTEKIYYLI